MRLTQVQAPATVQVLTQTLLNTALTELVFVTQSYEFTPEELASVGVTLEFVQQCRTMLDRLQAMIEKPSPPPVGSPTSLPPAA